MAKRINRAIELLEQDQPIYYAGAAHRPRADLRAGPRGRPAPGPTTSTSAWSTAPSTWPALAEYMRGLVDGGPTTLGPPHARRSSSRRRSTASTRPNVRFNAWQFRQILARGVHGILLCQAESADAVRAFVESCRYPHQLDGVDPALPTPLERLRGATRRRRRPTAARHRHARARLGADGRPIWGISSRGVPRAAAIPGRSTRTASCCSASSSRARRASPTARRSWPCPASASPSWARATSACRSATRRCRATPTRPRWRRRASRSSPPAGGTASPSWKAPRRTTSCAKIDEGVRVIAGHREDTAKVGRAHQKRTMPV